MKIATVVALKEIHFAKGTAVHRAAQIHLPVRIRFHSPLRSSAWSIGRQVRCTKNSIPEPTIRRTCDRGVKYDRIGNEAFDVSKGRSGKLRVGRLVGPQQMDQFRTSDQYGIADAEFGKVFAFRSCTFATVEIYRVADRSKMSRARRAIVRVRSNDRRRRRHSVSAPLLSLPFSTASSSISSNTD